MTARSLAVAVIVAVAAGPASAQISSNPKVLAPFKDVVAKASESTVLIRGDDKDIAFGTVVYADGFILTKASELRGALSVRLSDGTEYEAKILATHGPADLAMLKIDAKDLKPVAFADTKKVPVGNWLASPKPTSEALAVGIVSVQTRHLTGMDNEIDNYNRGYLGIQLDLTDPKDKEGKIIGAKIADVNAKGAAYKAGMKKNDVVIAVNGTKVLGRVALRDSLENSRPGDKVTLTVVREGEEKELKATLTGSPEPSRGDIQNAMGGELSGRRTGFPAVLQTDMVVEPKNCGGPVVDLDGNVLGVNIARAGRVETWILPSENIRPLLSDLKSGKSTTIPKK
jgi:serine protease Do